MHEEPPPERRRARCRNGAGCPWHKRGRCLFVHDEETQEGPQEVYIGTPRQSDDTGENKRLRKRVARLEQTVEELRNAILLLHQELGGGLGSDDFDTEGDDDDSEEDSSASTSTATDLEATPPAKPRRRRPRRKPPAARAAAAAVPAGNAAPERPLQKADRAEEEPDNTGEEAPQPAAEGSGPPPPGLVLTRPPARPEDPEEEPGELTQAEIEEWLRPTPPSPRLKEGRSSLSPPPWRRRQQGVNPIDEEATPEPPEPPATPRRRGNGGKEGKPGYERVTSACKACKAFCNMDGDSACRPGKGVRVTYKWTGPRQGKGCSQKR